MSYKPKVIGGEKVVSPKVISIGNKIPAETKVSSPEFSVTPTKINVFRSEAKPTIGITFPSAMKGSVRKSVVVDVSELKEKFPEIDLEILIRVGDRLIDFIPSAMNSFDCEKIGKDLQIEFNALISKSLTLMNDNRLKAGQRHLDRLRLLIEETLKELDAPSVFFRKKLTAKEILANSSKEIQLLQGLLTVSDSEIDSFEKELWGQYRTIAQLNDKISIELMAIDFLKIHFNQDKIDILSQREISLGQTIAQVKQQALLIDANIQSLNALSETIHTTVYVQTPSLMQCIMSVDDGELTDTQNYVIRNSLKNFMSTLT